MGTLKVNGHIEGNYIKANWLYTSATTEKTSIDKIACIGSDNFIYYITPANMNVGKATVATQVGRGGFYTAMRDWYEGGTTYSYVRIDLGQVTTWTMMSLELTIRESYGSGRSGKLHIYGNYSSSADWNNFYATRGERLSSNIKVYGSDKRYIYIAGVSAWGGVSIDQFLMGDSAYYYDWTSTVTMSGVSALPATYQTATMIRSWTSEDTIPLATAATYLKDSSTSTATYLNYGASGITSTSWMAAWNGYELRAMSPDYVCASRLYSTDSSYKYSSSAPYYGYLTYSSPYWDFKVYPGTPADVRVSRAYTAGTADNADTVDGYHASSFLRKHGWWNSSNSGYSADNMEDGIAFAYTNHGVPSHWGTLCTFGYGNGRDYNLQLHGAGNNQLFFRNRSSDYGQGSWQRVQVVTGWGSTNPNSAGIRGTNAGDVYYVI